MKILLISPSSYDTLFEMRRCLEKLGHVVRFAGTEYFADNCNYIGKKLYQFGWRNLKNKYYRRLNKDIIATYASFEPDLVLVTNGTRLSKRAVEYMKQQSEVVLWLFDSIRRGFMNPVKKVIASYDAVYVFERPDIAYLKKRFGVIAKYCPAGYNAYQYYPRDSQRGIDLIFVGNYLEHRLDVLREIAKYAQQNTLDFRIYGHWYANKPFWKRLQFKKKEAELFPYIINHEIAPEEVAKLYCQSKICLNIHAPMHKGVNPRTFDILATRSFQLIDERSDYGDLVKPQVDFATYNSIPELIRKIEYYLSHEVERKLIANQGYRHIQNHITMESCIKRILTDAI